MIEWDTGRTVERILVKMFPLHNIFKQATTFSHQMPKARKGGAVWDITLSRRRWCQHGKVSQQCSSCLLFYLTVLALHQALLIVGFAHAQCITASLLYFVFPTAHQFYLPSVQWPELQSLKHCCKVQAGSSVNISIPLGTKESSFMQQQKLPPAVAGVDLSPQIFSTFYCGTSRLMGLLSLAHTLFSCLMSHHSSSCCRMTICLQKLSQRALFCSLPKEKCCTVWHAVSHQQSGSLMLKETATAKWSGQDSHRLKHQSVMIIL